MSGLARLYTSFLELVPFPFVHFLSPSHHQDLKPWKSDEAAQKYTLSGFLEALAGFLYLAEPEMALRSNRFRQRVLKLGGALGTLSWETQQENNGVATSGGTRLIPTKGGMPPVGEELEGIFLCFLEIKLWRGLLVVRIGFPWPGHRWLPAPWQEQSWQDGPVVRFQALGWDAWRLAHLKSFKVTLAVFRRLLLL